MNTAPPRGHDRRRRQRLQRLQARLEVPMIVLAFVWLALFVVEAVWGMPPWLDAANWLIWALFLLEFAVGLVLTPRKGAYLRRTWLKALALAAPALRVLRVFRVLRLARAAGLVRGTRMVRIVSSLNRLRERRRGAGLPRLRRRAVVDGDDHDHHGLGLLA